MEAKKIEKPSQVSTAVNLLWASLAVGFFKSIRDMQHLGSQASPAVANFILISAIAARVGRNKRSALRRIVFEWCRHGEGSDRDPAGYGFAQPALRELPRVQVDGCQAGSSLGRTTTRRIS